MSGASRYSFDDISVMVIEGDLFFRSLYTSIFRRLGAQKEMFSDTSDALSYMLKTNVDIIMTEYRSKPLDGISFIKHVRRNLPEPLRYIPIIMLTSHSEFDIIETARDAGVTEFLAKPIAPKTLIDRLFYTIDRPRPFVLGEEYTGPERRRHDDSQYDGFQRRLLPKSFDEPSSCPDGLRKESFRSVGTHQISTKASPLVT